MEQATNMSLENIRCFAAGLTALIQVTVLPGWLVVSRFGTGTLLIDVLAALVVSLVATFNIAFLLQLTGAYDRIALSVIVIGEILLLTLLNRRNTGVVTKLPVPLRLWTRNGFLVANIIALVIMLWFVMRMLLVLWSHVPGVFEEWDAVVSWSRWAVDWYEGHWPVETYGYPQLVPVMWSVTYLWLGSDQIEIFSRAMMGLFPIAILAVFFFFFFKPAPTGPLNGRCIAGNRNAWTVRICSGLRLCRHPGDVFYIVYRIFDLLVGTKRHAGGETADLCGYQCGSSSAL
ncbi:MAG: hypothetical protein V1844_15395 [Pseudomonadota bacterium]